jgi:hypothetical protein
MAVPIGNDFIVNTTTACDQVLPTVTILPDGHFVVAWQSADGGDGSGSLIRARLFNADGASAGNDFVVNSTTFGGQITPTVTALPDGRFVVTWKSDDGGDGFGNLIRARLFNADGTAARADFVVNSTTTPSRGSWVNRCWSDSGSHSSLRTDRAPAAISAPKASCGQRLTAIRS